MRRMISTLELDKIEWLKYRKMGITGTDAGAICGLNPYVSAFQVYQDKISYETEENDNESMRQGRDMEEYVAQRFTEDTGFKVRKANAIFQNEEHPIMLADFDRLLSGLPYGKKAGLECKTVSPYLAEKWKNGNIPLHYQMQVQHYLAVSGYDYWYIAALIFGKEFIIRRIDRDEELIANLITIEENFWNENIMKHVMPDPDGTEKCSKIISEMYYKTDRDKSIRLLGCNDLLERRQEIDGLIKKMEKEKSQIEQKIKMEMKDASYGLTEKFRVSWTAFDTIKLDSKKLKEENPQIYSEYSKTSTNRRFTVSAMA